VFSGSQHALRVSVFNLVKGLKPTKEEAFVSIFKTVGWNGKRQACGHSLRSLLNDSDYFDYFKGDREGRPYLTTLTTLTTFLTKQILKIHKHIGVLIAVFSLTEGLVVKNLQHSAQHFILRNRGLKFF
jgi:hypothetical protein